MEHPSSQVGGKGNFPSPGAHQEEQRGPARPRRETQYKAMLENFKYRIQIRSLRHHKSYKVMWAAFSGTDGV